MTTYAAEADTQLMCRVRDGDVSSFGYLVDRHRAPIAHFVYRMVHDRAIAEELTQEVFFRVYRARASYVPTAKFTTWLFRIASHLALNSLRDSRHERGRESLDLEREYGSTLQLPDFNPTVEQRLLLHVQLQEVRNAILALPSNQRSAVIMHKYQEMSYEQIAAALQCSESATKSLLFRAYERLRHQLAHLAVSQARVVFETRSSQRK